LDWPDYAVLGIVAISILVGVLRGFVKEAFSLAVWAAAFLAAFSLSGPVADMLQDSISLPSARTALAFAGVFIAVLLVGGLLTYLVGKLVEKTGLSGTDRLLGGAFGACRGLILVVVLILVAGLTPIPGDPWWSESRSIQSLLPLAEWASTFLPDSILQYLDLYPPPESVAKEA
jgi:membrane protein required for colicin V production